MRIRVRLLAADGSLIAQTEAAAVGVGQFQSFDFNRDEISLRGEANRPSANAARGDGEGQTRYGNIVPNQEILETFEDAVEVIDNSGGRTTVSFSGGVNEIILNDSPGNESLNPKTFQIISAGKDYLIGIVPGQTLCVSVLNPLAPPPPGVDGRKFKMLFAVTILLADGRVVAQSDEITLDPGQFHSFEFKRADLPLADGRQQVRVRVTWIKLQLKPEFPSLLTPLQLNS